MTPAPPTDLLVANRVHAGYGSTLILRGVDFRVGVGEVVGLMGRNGMGKTTLIRTLTGQLPVQAGQVFLNGADVSGDPPWQRSQAGIAVVPEGRGIFASLSVRENLEVAARHGLDGQRHWTLDRVLDAFPRLSQRLTHRGNQLSGGEQQMLAIGRALMTNPHLLILDEATEGLAPMIRSEIWRTIRQLRDSTISIVIVDKTVSAVLSLVDRVTILVKGTVVYNGIPKNLQENEDILQKNLGIGIEISKV